jgi:hypothetical protein
MELWAEFLVQHRNQTSDGRSFFSVGGNIFLENVNDCRLLKAGLCSVELASHGKILFNGVSFSRQDSVQWS